MRRDAASGARWRAALAGALLTAACRGGDPLGPAAPSRSIASPSRASATAEPCVPSTPIAFNQTIDGTIADTDCKLSDGSYADPYVLTLTASTTIQVDLSSTAFDTYLLVTDAQGNEVAHDDDGGGGSNSRIRLTLAAGSYAVWANAYEPNKFGPYTLRLTNAGTSGGGTSTGAPACPPSAGVFLNQTATGGTLTATSCRLNDGSAANAHPLTLGAATTVQLDLKSSEFDAYLVLTDSSGNVLSRDDDGGGGTNARIVRTLGAGKYIVWATSSRTNAQGAYTLAATGITFSGGTSCQSSPISPGQIAAGTINGADCVLADNVLAHPHTLSLNTATTVQIDLSSGEFDPLLVLTDVGGTTITTDDNSGGGTTARIVRALPAGQYIVWATGAVKGAQGAYTLTVSATGGGTGCSSSPIALGQSVSGTLATGGCKLGDGSNAIPFTFTLAASTTVRVDLHSSTFDPFLVVADAAGNVVARDDDGGGGTDSRVVKTLPAGQYVVWASSYAAGANGGFQLSLAAASTTTNCPNRTTITIGDTQNASLTTSDCELAGGTYVDVYTFTVPSGDSKAIQLDMTSSAFNAYLTLTRADGSVVAEDDDDGGSGNARIRTTLGAGSYVILATSYSPRATGSYGLTLTASGTGATDPCAQSVPIGMGQTIDGFLASTDCRLPDGSFADVYALDVREPMTVQFDLKSTAFDAYLILTDANGRNVAMDDDGGGEGTNSRIRTKLAAGRYFIYANSYGVTGRGAYSLSAVAR
jgi:hypothetical protein